MLVTLHMQVIRFVIGPERVLLMMVFVIRSSFMALKVIGVYRCLLLFRIVSISVCFVGGILILLRRVGIVMIMMILVLLLRIV